MRKFLVAACALGIAAPITAQQPIGDLPDIALRYIAAQEAVMEKGAGQHELETLMSFYSPDYTYYHPQFGAKVTGLDTVQRGISSHFGETADAEINVKGILTSGNMVSLALEESFIDLATGKHIERDRMTVLTIKGGKVSQRIDM